MRQKIIAGNWKMNKTFSEADDLVFKISELIDDNYPTDVLVVLCPPFPFLELATDLTQDNDIYIGAQNVSNHDFGAYTGEVSAAMLKSIDVDFCIIGHSERRKYFNEDSSLLAEKVVVLLKNDIIPIFCCGEILPEREAGKYFNVVKEQIISGLLHLDSEQFKKIVIAYEPVWAIGTGVNATPEQAQEMHAFIREIIAKKYGAEVAENTTILYGGSCNSENAKELFANPDVDGGLIGGASLQAEEFVEIVNSF